MPGFVGFAVGRTIWWDALEGWLRGGEEVGDQALRREPGPQPVDGGPDLGVLGEFVADLGDVAGIEEIAAEAVEAVKGCRPLRCTLHNFNTSSLDYQLVFEMKSVDPDRLARDRAAIMMGLIERFAAEGIGFAYPVQIAFTAGPDGSLLDPTEGKA